MSEVNSQSQPLKVMAMPLRGRHLIEASAGTGKTFNITRIFLRLLLEKQLQVEQILVMTFTKAATEEIRGRIAETLRDAVTLWRKAMAEPDSLASADSVFQALYQIAPAEQGLARLEAALLVLDEASVFTIHGFCNKVLSEMAFASGTPMSIALETDTQSLWDEATEDWIRIIATQPANYQLLLEKGWHVPTAFYDEFRQALRSTLAPEYCDSATIEAQFDASLAAMIANEQPLMDEIATSINANQAFILDNLVNSKKGAELAKRQAEWQAILDWFEAGVGCIPDAQIKSFVSGTRYARAAFGADMKVVLAPLSELVKRIELQHKQLSDQKQASIAMQPVFALVADGFHFIRQHVSQTKRRLGIVDFDDLVKQLAEHVQASDGALKSALRDKYPVALIDEFQDTDAHQYSILEHVYRANDDHHMLMMIGDPKQAIYGFRGGDIFTYLRAGKQADYRWVMDTNWRSVKPMVDAYNRLFYGTPVDAGGRDVFGYDIRYEPVNATEHAKAAKTPLTDPAERFALSYVVLETEEGESQAGDYLDGKLAQWMSHEIVRLLNDAQLAGRPLRPADIAILVRSGGEADTIKFALKKVGLSAVYLSTNSSLFQSAEAADVYRVLDGIWHSEQIQRLSAALSSPLLGHDHATIVAMLHDEDDALWEACMARIAGLRQIWRRQGCMAVMLELLRRDYVPNDEDTERHLTNYLHLAEVLEQAAAGIPQPEQLLLWLHRQIAEPEQSEELVQRLESDANLIQIITQHGSKGLEYPIVFVPFASKYKDPAKQGNTTLNLYRYFDASRQQQVLQLGETNAAIEQVRAEGNAEAMRLLYVAITRAAHRCYLGCAPYKGSELSPLGKALGVKDDSQWHLAIHGVSEEQGGHTGALAADMLPVAHHSQAEHEKADALHLAEFDGDIDDAWRLYSFSALTRQQVAVKHTQRDEEVIDNLSVGGQAVLDESRPIRFTLEKGAAAGNLLHDLLEHTDFSAPDWLEHRDMGTRLNLDDVAFRELSQWLDEVLAAPLADDLTMATLPLSQTLREAEFYFPVINANWWAISRILQAHREQVNGADAQPVPMLSQPQLEGMMHGFVDLIFEHDGKYYVADYKSTHLGDTCGDYSFARIAANNQKHLYDLQYLLYALALHRYLQASLPGYQPESQFGGVYYLYLRGMHPDNAAREGVYYTHIDIDTLQALDSAFSGGSVEVSA